MRVYGDGKKNWWWWRSGKWITFDSLKEVRVDKRKFPMAEETPSSPGQSQKKQTVRINLPPKQTASPTVKLNAPKPGGPAAPKSAAAAPAKAAPASAAGAPAGRVSSSAPGPRPMARRAPAASGGGVGTAITLMSFVFAVISLVPVVLVFLTANNG